MFQISIVCFKKCILVFGDMSSASEIHPRLSGALVCTVLEVDDALASLVHLVSSDVCYVSYTTHCHTGLRGALVGPHL